MQPFPRGAGRRFLLALVLASLALSAGATDKPATLDLAPYRGKVVLIDFWASWCEPCRDSIPWLNAMQEKYGGQGLVVIGVNVDRERAEADRFLRDIPARFAIVYDPRGEIATRYDLPGLPVSYLVGPGGELVARHVGFQSGRRADREAQLLKNLEALR